MFVRFVGDWRRLSRNKVSSESLMTINSKSHKCVGGARDERWKKVFSKNHVRSEDLIVDLEQNLVQTAETTNAFSVKVKRILKNVMCFKSKSTLRTLVVWDESVQQFHA